MLTKPKQVPPSHTRGLEEARIRDSQVHVAFILT